MINNRIIIAGGRNFRDWHLLKESVNYYTFLMPPDDIEIVYGGCSGADDLGEQYAEINCIPIKRFQADWGKYGKNAGPIRNKEMAAYATHLIAFWDGESKGTKNMIDEAKAAGLKIRIVKF